MIASLRASLIEAAKDDEGLSGLLVVRPLAAAPAGFWGRLDEREHR
jgi:hypothetical protein